MTTLWETKQDRANETRIAKFVAKAKDLKQKKLAKAKCQQDRIFYEETGKGLKEIAIAEIKCRTDYFFAGFETIIIASKKFDSLICVAKRRGVTPVLIVEFAEGVYSYAPKTYAETATFERKMGGRTKDYRDEKDIHEVVHIPRDKFEKIESSPCQMTGAISN